MGDLTGMIYIKRKKLTKAGRRYWVYPINELQLTEGAWNLLIKHFRDEHQDKHASCMREIGRAHV